MKTIQTYISLWIGVEIFLPSFTGEWTFNLKKKKKKIEKKFVVKRFFDILS